MKLPNQTLFTILWQAAQQWFEASLPTAQLELLPTWSSHSRPVHHVKLANLRRTAAQAAHIGTTHHPVNKAEPPTEHLPTGCQSTR